jgi:hypothetical protein
MSYACICDGKEKKEKDVLFIKINKTPTGE